MLHSGGVKMSYLRVCSHHFTKTSILLSMPVLSTIVQKGGDCNSKVLPPCVLDIVGQDSRGTNNVFKCKQLIRFLKDKPGDKASRTIYKLSKLNSMSEVLS